MTDDPLRASLVTAAARAFDLGFLGPERPDLSGIYDLTILNAVRRAADRPPIP